MRYLKKYIRKLYHLIWFLSAFILFMPYANAVTQINGAEFSQPSILAFADNTNGQLTRINSDWVDYGHYYRSNSSILTNGADTGGANWVFYSDVPFVQGHTYALSVLIGMANTYAITNTTSRSRLCIAETLTFAISRYNNYSFTCTTSWATSTNGVSAFNDGSVTYNYTLLSYVFTADFTSNAITGSYNSGVSNESNHTFGGYIVEELSSQPLTQSQITSAVQNSGLATANSIQQVQESINQIESDINSSANNIIDNQNENTEKEIESRMVCNRYDKNSIETDNYYLSGSGSLTASNTAGTTGYIKVDMNSKVKLLSQNSFRVCYYDINKTVINCVSTNDLTVNSYITLPNNTEYIRFSISKNTNQPQFEVCKNGNQALNDNITDSSIDSSDDTINNLKNHIPTNSVISDLLLLPVRFLQNFVNALGSSCSSFSLGSLYGTELFMPCINIDSYLGSSIWTAIDLIISGLFVYSLRKKFIEIYENLTNLKNGGNEVD